MKLHLPLKLYKALILAVAGAVTFTQDAYAGAMHTDVSIQTYTDFGQNRGRYAVGAQENALLKHIRQQDGGIKITYTDGTKPFIISNDQGMIDFRGTFDNGALVAVSPTFTATVLHNGSNNASYGNRTVGSDHSIKYQTIDIRGSNVFRLHPDGHGNDYMLQRQSKLQTDAGWNPVTKITDMSEVLGDYLYHSGGGGMQMYDGKNFRGMIWPYAYIVGGIETINEAVTHQNTTNTSICMNTNYYAGWGACEANPMPNAIRGGDSGSPIFIYNDKTKRYEYIAAMQSGSDTFGQARGNVVWTHAIMDSFNVKVDMSTENTVYLNAINDKVKTETDNNGVTTDIYEGDVTDGNGKVLASYQGLQHGQNTWSDLNDIKNNEKWYAYTGHLNQNIQDLFFNENLVFSSTAADNKIILKSDVDLGVGYVEFNAGKYTISANGAYQLDSAGYVLNEGAEVHLKLTNSDIVKADDGTTHTRMTEWRALGEGTLYIDGSGDTYALLNLGGKSTTYLNQENGYAAYNVLVNTGAKVVIKDVNQIKRDFTFGSGGGTLDLNDNDHTWNNGGTADGFTIHALTEEAIISNGAGHSTLTITNAGEKYLGSFQDSEGGSLKVVYNGGEGNTLAMHGIHTNLKNHDDSGFEVESGTVSLSGIHTVHGMGSASGTTVHRLVNTRDWHYADATMDVSVKNGATFELGSHARLTGDVTVENGGTFLMREGVQYDYEYVEGGAALEETSKYAEFYGHHGTVSLADGAKMRIEYSDGVSASQSYAGDITGTGELSIHLGDDGAVLTLQGDNSEFYGKKTLESGNLLAEDSLALGNCTTNKWVIQEAGVLGLMGSAITQEMLGEYVDTISTGVLALTSSQENTLNLENHKGLIIGAAEGFTVEYGSDGKQLQAYDNQWVLGGGGGELVVKSQLTGQYDLVLGNEHASGVVTLANKNNNFSGSIRFTGKVTLNYTDAAALGDASILLGYANRAFGHNGTENFHEDCAGTMLVDNMQGDIDLTQHKGLYLGSNGDATLSGKLTVADGEAYKFGGTTGTLTVESDLVAGHGLVVDAQTFTGGEIQLAKATGIDGEVSVMGYNGEDYTDGEIVLSFGENAANALKDATKVTAKDGGIIDLAGTQQTFKNLVVEAGGYIGDSVGNGELVVHKGSVVGSVELDKLSKSGEDELIFSGNSSIGELTLESGKLTLGNASDGVTTNTNVTNLHVKGGELILANREYHVGALFIHQDASFDVKNAQADGFSEYVPQVVLAGGTLKNTGAHVSNGLRQLYALTLTADSTVDSLFSFGLIGSGYTETSVDLGGYHLTKTGANTFMLYNTSVTEGEITVTGGTLEYNDRADSKGNVFDNTVAASIIESGGKFNVTKTSSGTLTFSGDHTDITTLTASNGTVCFTGGQTDISTLNLSNGTIICSGDTVNVQTVEAGAGAVLDLAGNRLNIGGISSSAAITITGGTLGILKNSASEDESTTPENSSSGGEWATNVNINLTGDLTVDTDVNVIFRGKISATDSSLTKLGANALTIEGDGVELDNLTVLGGTVLMRGDNQTIAGDLTISKGAALTISTAYELGAGKNLTVLDGSGGDYPCAFLMGSVTIAGGSITFSGEALASLIDGFPALWVTSYTTAAEAKHEIRFIDAHALTVNNSYALTNISIDIDKLESPEMQYLEATYSNSGDGYLCVSFSEKEGYALWDGTTDENTWSATAFAQHSEGLSAEDTAVFNDSAVEKTVEVSGALSVKGLLFDNTEAYQVNADGEGNSLTAETLDVQAGGDVTVNGTLTVSKATTISDGRLTVDGTASLAATTMAAGTELTLKGTTSTAALKMAEDTKLTVSGQSTAASVDVGENAALIIDVIDGGNTEFTVNGNLALADGVSVSGKGALSAQSMSLAEAGSTTTFDGVKLSVTGATDVTRFNMIGVDSHTTLNLMNGAEVEDNHAAYLISGTLNLNAERSTAESTLYVNRLALSQSNVQSFVNIDKNVHLVITGEAPGVTTDTVQANGSFCTSVWGSELRNKNLTNAINIEGKLTSNAVINNHDNRANINVLEGAELNLLKGAVLSTARGTNVTINVHQNARLNAAGGTHHDNLIINLSDGSTLGGVAATAGGVATFTNNLNIGNAGETRTIAVDTAVKGIGENYALTEGAAGIINLDGTISSAGNTTLNVEGSGELNMGTIRVSGGQLDVVGGSSTVHIKNVALAQGAILSGANFSLDAGATFTVLAGTGSAADFRGDVVFNGGTLDVSAVALSSSGVLNIGGSISSNAGLKLNLAGGVYDTGTQYKVASGNFENVKFSAFDYTFADDSYYDVTYQATAEGLFVSMKYADGNIAWQGTDADNTWSAESFSVAALGSDDVAIFTDAAANRSVSVKGDVSASSMVFTGSEAYEFTGNGSVTAKEVSFTAASEVTLGAALTVENDLIINNNAHLNMDANLNAKGAVTVESGAQLNLGGVLDIASTLTLKNGSQLEASADARLNLAAVSDTVSTSLQLESSKGHSIGGTLVTQADKNYLIRVQKGSANHSMNAVELAQNAKVTVFSTEQAVGTVLINTLNMADSASLSTQNHAGNVQVDCIYTSGKGALNLVNESDSVYTSIFTLGDASVANSGNFAGFINLSSTHGGDKRSASLILANENIAQKAVVNLDSAASSTAVLSLGINDNTVRIAGLESEATLADRAVLYSGEIGTRKEWSEGAINGRIDRTLVINTAEANNNYSFHGSVLGHLHIEKDGDGTQTFAGDSTKLTGATVKAGQLNIGDGSSKGLFITKNKADGADASIGASISTDDGGSTVTLAGTGSDNKAIVSNALIDVMAGCTLNLSHVELLDTTRITDDPATLSLDDVVAHVTANNSSTAVAVTEQMELTMMDGDTTRTVEAGAQVLDITSSLMDTVTVTDGSMVIALGDGIDLAGYDYVSLTFTDGEHAASFSTDMSVTLLYEGQEYDVYYRSSDAITAAETGEEGTTTTTFYAAVPVPEPTTATLSLLALAALAARRRR